MTPKPSKTGREKIASPIRKVDAQSTTKEETRLQVIAHYNYTGVVVGQSDLSALRLWASPLRTPKRKRANKDLIVTNKTKNNGNKKQHTYQALQHIIERGSQPKNTRIYAKYRRDKNLPRSSTCSRQRALDKPTLWRLRLADTLRQHQTDGKGEGRSGDAKKGAITQNQEWQDYQSGRMLTHS